MKVVMALTATLLLSGCGMMGASLDYKGDPKKDFEFQWGWDHRIEQSKAKPGKTDEKGVYEPEEGAKEAVNALLSFPTVSVGLAVEVQPEARVTPTINLEAFRFKVPVPYMRWWVVQVGGGAQLAEAYLGKLIVPVVDVTVGPWVGWDFDLDDVAWGIQGTIFKF